MNDDLQPTARKVQQAEANKSGAVPLDQPHPEELSMPTPENIGASSAESTTDAGTQEASSHDTSTEAANGQRSDTDTNSSKNQRSDSSPFQQTLPPTPHQSSDKPHTMPILLLGAAFVIVGVIIMIIGSLAFGIIMAIVGAGAIAVGLVAPAKA